MKTQGVWVHMSRHKLPAPPLVLQPILCRVPAASSRAQALLDAAGFLSSRGLLTDGGEKNLVDLLEGRGGMVSLTTQDVRAWAHALTLEILEESSPNRWPEIATVYFKTYDKGKPRRPNRMQRLYIEWSADASWLGMLEACQNHPQLWGPVKDALQSLNPDNLDARIFQVYLAATDSSDWAVWKAAFELHPKERRQWLAMLPYFNFLNIDERLTWLGREAENLQSLPQLPPWAPDLFLACRRERAPEPLPLPETLVSLLFSLLQRFEGEIDPCWIGALRNYRVSQSDLVRFQSAISKDDPIRRIALGPRPGRPWLPLMWDLLKVDSAQS